MTWIIENWYIIVCIAAVFVSAIFAVLAFFYLPFDKQYEKVRKWLLWAVSQAEKELGGGTGRLKLSMAYDMFVTKFPWLARLISFDRFSQLVDTALDEMRTMIETNPSASRVITGNELEE